MQPGIPCPPLPLPFSLRDSSTSCAFTYSNTSVCNSILALNARFPVFCPFHPIISTTKHFHYLLKTIEPRRNQIIMTHKIEKLEEILRDQFGFNHGGLKSFSTDTGVAFDSFNQPPPLITSEGQSKYDSEQIKAFFERDFLLRLFITNTNITGKTVFLRTKFGDNHPHASHLNPVRDFLKATNAEHYTAAKTNCTELISTCLYAFSEKSTSSASKYYSFAVTMASGLSNFGSNTDFEFHPNLVKSKGDVDMARKKMCLLMHIIFSKISMYRYVQMISG